MALKEENISKDILTTAKCSIDNTKIKSIMPQNEKESELKKYTNHVLVMPAEFDCLFPSKKIITKVKRVWKQSQIYLLRGRGHIHQLSEDEKKLIISALQNQTKDILRKDEE